MLPLILQAIQRAAGRTDRAQEEVLVVEEMGRRLVEFGTPYLDRDAIAALPIDERLMGYHPYQPGMALFGLPRAFFGDVWWTDARVWFAIVTAAALVTAFRLLAPSSLAVRALQAATVMPICALTLATGGDDIPVLALCLLSLALIATERYGWAGLAVGAAAACKLLAFPAVAVLVVLAVAAGRTGARPGRPAARPGQQAARPGQQVARPGRLVAGAIGLPVLALVPPFLVNADAFVENVIRFPLGHGLVTSPAQSPFPGQLITAYLPGGRFIAAGLLVAVAAFITVRIVCRPPRSAGSASMIIGLGLLAAILLMPTTRFGYLLYPIAFLVWAPALDVTAQAPQPEHSNHTAPSSPAG